MSLPPLAAATDSQYLLSASLVLTNHTMAPTRKNHPSSRYHSPVAAVTGSR